MDCKLHWAQISLAMSKNIPNDETKGTIHDIYSPSK